MISVLSIPHDLTSSMVTGTAVTAGSLANLVSNRVGLVARWSSAAGTKTINIDLGSAKTVGVVAALWSNLRSTDKVRIKAGTSSGGSQTYDSGEIGAWYSTVKKTSAGTKSMLVLPSPISARYWTIELIVKTSALPEGYTELSRIFLGERIEFSVDYTTIDMLDDDRGGVDRSDYGEDIEDVRRVSFGWRPRWRYGSQAEMLSAHRLLVMRGSTKPILFCPMTADIAADAQDLIAFGKLRSPARTASAVYDIWEMSFEIYSEAA